LADTSSDQSCWTISSSLPPPPSSSPNKIVTPITISSCRSIAEFFILRRRRLTEQCNNLWRRGAFQICDENMLKERKPLLLSCDDDDKASASWIMLMLLLCGPP
jgi:hypothetical protein